MEQLTNAASAFIQVVFGVVACGVGYLVPTGILFGRGFPGWKERRLRHGLFGILAGLLLGVLAPSYLETQGWWTVTLVLLGGALLFSEGVASLGGLMWGEGGVALGILGFAAVLSYVDATHQSVVGPRSILLRIGVLVGLFEAIPFLVQSFRFSPGSEEVPEKPNVGKKVVSWIGVVTTLLGFLNTILGIWEKLVR